MPGPTHIPVCPITIQASTVLTPFRFVGTDSGLSGAGENTLGVALHSAEIGDYATIEVLGFVSVETGAAVTAGALVESDASGRAIDKTAGAAVARAVDESSAAGEFVRCILLPN